MEPGGPGLAVFESLLGPCMRSLLITGVYIVQGNRFTLACILASGGGSQMEHSQTARFEKGAHPRSLATAQRAGPEQIIRDRVSQGAKESLPSSAAPFLPPLPELSPFRSVSPQLTGMWAIVWRLSEAVSSGTILNHRQALDGFTGRWR